MAKQRKRWDFYKVGRKDTPKLMLTYELVKSTSQHWPGRMFKRWAHKLGYSRFREDQTIIGGYFINPASGDCLVCVGHGMNVQQITEGVL